ncbi:DUF6516 family protein [Ruegeria sp. HKCCA5929]|uniref:toxin-antitoxin system TumE family protein n=1 Tax=Ruegeria sp. HKCCA5929 TaxID=2682988 RepID=UPI0020C41460|nr:DUF6516 family protein [Ruegeria sp. HKCCA5929]
MDTLLELHGQTYFLGDNGFRVKFDVRRVEVTDERPHGLKYSLTLHEPKGDRVVGFDNAHAIEIGNGPAKKKLTKYDHKHRFRTIGPYDYEDAATLLGDFWAEVDSVLDELGVKL